MGQETGDGGQISWNPGGSRCVLHSDQHIDFCVFDVWLPVFMTVDVRSAGKMPTVVSPELYRARFCEAMDKYFLMVPDHWTGLGVNC